MTTIDHDRFDLVVPYMVAANQKQAIRLMSAEISRMIGIQERILFDRMMDSEKESPSAIGGGLALTHLHISGLNKSVSAFFRFKTNIDFNAPDHEAVDMVCVLLTPEREGAAYLRHLARLSRTLRNAHFCQMLRNAQNEKEIRALFEQSPPKTLAA